VANHQALHLGNRVVFLVELDQVLGLPADQKAARQLQVFVGERGGDVLRRHAERRGALEIHVDPDGALLHAAELHLAHAVDGLEPLLEHRAGVGVELRVGAIAFQRQPHDGLRARFELGHHWRVGVVRQALDGLADLGLHLVEGDVDVLAELEDHHDQRHARQRLRLDALDARRAVDRAFDHVGNRRVDDLGVGALERGDDRHRRKLDFRVSIDTDALVRDQPEQHDQQAQHERQDVPLDGDFRKRHEPCSRSFTGAPSDR
jgi:hypothetical protein